MEELIKRIRQESRKLFPRPMRERELRAWLRKFDPDIHTPQYVSSCWDTKKEQHIQQWRDRFGLDDHNPFEMSQSSEVLKVSWAAEKDTHTGEAFVIIRYMVGQKNRLVEYIPLNKPTKELINKVGLKIKTYAEQHRMVMPEGSVMSIPGDLILFQMLVPQHDWVVWQKNLLGDNPGLRKQSVLNQVKKYREGKSQAKTLEELERLILDDL